MTWGGGGRFYDDKRHDALKTFSPNDGERRLGRYRREVKLIGRWHDLAGFTGVAIAESDDPQAIATWVLQLEQYP